MAQTKRLPRREFFKRASGWVFGGFAISRLLSAAETEFSNPVGYATISWPRSKFDHALQTISRLGFKGVQLLGWTSDAFAGGKAAQLRERLSALSLQPVTLSCSDIELDPANLADVSEKFLGYATFFKTLNGKFLQMTDGGRPGATYRADQMRAFGQGMNQLGKIAQDAGLAMGYHPHVGTLGETREGLGQVLDSTDPQVVKLIADVAHLTLGGSDPAEVISTYRERLLFCHFKDVRKDAAELHREKPAALGRAKYQFTEIGTGTVDFPAIIRTFRDIAFNGWVIVELDDSERRPGGPDESAEMSKSAVESLGLRL